MQELRLLVAGDAFEQCCSHKTFVLLSYSCAYICFELHNVLNSKYLKAIYTYIYMAGFGLTETRAKQLQLSDFIIIWQSLYMMKTE